MGNIIIGLAVQCPDGKYFASIRASLSEFRTTPTLSVSLFNERFALLNFKRFCPARGLQNKDEIERLAKEYGKLKQPWRFVSK